jgi:flavin-dependent dehydrogenase
MRYDAVIIGAGPAGSCAALALARQGRSVAIVEKTAFPRRKVCGEFMSATNAALLDRLGLGDEWRETAGPEIRRVALFAGEGWVTAAMPAGSGGFGRALGRDVLDAMLLAAARTAGAEVFQPFRATGIVCRSNASVVRIAARERELELHAPAIIAAHGSWEQGSLPSNLPRRNHPSDLLGFKAHFLNAALPADLMPLLVFPGGYGGMVTADRGRLSLSCCIRRDELARLRQLHGGVSAAEAVQRHIVASCRGVRETLARASLDGRWLAAGPIRPGIRPRYADDIFRVGNCAGESHPIVAEGISMALQSAWLLASALARADVNDATERERAGRLYAAAWRRQFATRIHAAAAFAAVALNPAGARAMGPLIGRFPGILSLGAALSGKTRELPSGMGRRSVSVNGSFIQP